MPDHARQAPPNGRPDDNRTTEEEQSNSISPQGWVDLFRARSDSSHSIAEGVGEADHDRGDTE
jgi:hypothetical protein